MERLFLSIPVSVEIKNEDVVDIMTTAFYGGITYWCSKVTFEGERLDNDLLKHFILGGHIRMFDAEDDTIYIINKGNVIDGIKRHIEHGGYSIVDNSQTGMCIDTCMIDADIADSIIQYGLFNELVFA